MWQRFKWIESQAIDPWTSAGREPLKRTRAPLGIDEVDLLERRIVEVMKATVLANSCSFNLAEVVLVELKQVTKCAYLGRRDRNDLDPCWSTTSYAIVRHSTCQTSVASFPGSSDGSPRCPFVGCKLVSRRPHMYISLALSHSCGMFRMIRPQIAYARRYAARPRSLGISRADVRQETVVHRRDDSRVSPYRDVECRRPRDYRCRRSRPQQFCGRHFHSRDPRRVGIGEVGCPVSDHRSAVRAQQDSRFQYSLLFPSLSLPQDPVSTRDQWSGGTIP